MKVYGRNGIKLFGLWFENKSKLVIEGYIYPGIRFGINNESDSEVGVIDIFLFKIKILIAFKRRIKE